jgi:hypothetical protein
MPGSSNASSYEDTNAKLFLARVNTGVTVGAVSI